MSTQAKNLPAAATLTALPTGRPEGWTPQRQAAFLRALSATHNVAAAARAVGMSRQSAYRLRARLKSQPFDLAWDAAFQCAFDALAQAAMERALNGVPVPHYHQGELVGTSRRFDERLTIALLAMRAEFLCAPAPEWHPSAKYDLVDFPGLLERVERGPAMWQGDEPDAAAWESADLPDDTEPPCKVSPGLGD